MIRLFDGCCLQASARRRDVGAFQQLPVVSPGYEILGSALRRAKLVRPTKGSLAVLMHMQIAAVFFQSNVWGPFH